MNTELINELAQQFNAIDKINWEYGEKMIDLMKKLDKETLLEIYKRKIKWLKPLALNQLIYNHGLTIEEVKAA